MISDYNLAAKPGECVSGFAADICFLRGITKMESGDNRGAILELSNLIKAGYDHPEHYYYRGLARQKNSDRQGAMQDYQAVLQSIEERYYNANPGKPIALKNQDLEDVGVQNDSYKVYLFRGLAYFGLGKISFAIANFNEAIKLEPNNPEAYHHRGVAYQALKDRNNAIKDLKMADRLYLNENQLNKHRIVNQLLRKI